MEDAPMIPQEAPADATAAQTAPDEQQSGEEPPNDSEN